jgi:hypothetical protein
MKQKLARIREAAIEAREKLSYSNTADPNMIAKLDKIIRGAVLVKWMHHIAACFFIVFAAVFISLVYPDAKSMMLIAGFAMAGYAISRFGVAIQLKLYDRTIGKVRSTVLNG